MKDTVALVPSLTVNDWVLLRIDVLLYDALPFPDAVILREYVVGGIASNVTAKVVFAVILLIVYLLFDTLDVTSVLFNFTLLIRYPVSGVNEIVAFVPSLTVND